MAEETKEELVELEVDEDAIVAYLYDEDDNEIGFVIMEDGQEVECYYSDEDAEAFANGSVTVVEEDAEDAEELIELEVDEDLIVAYLCDENDNEIGFVVMEDGQEVEYYYADDPAPAASSAAAKPAAAKVAQDDAVTKEDLREMAADLWGFFKDASESLSGAMDQFDDVMDKVDEINPKKHRQRRQAEKAAEKAAAAAAAAAQQAAAQQIAAQQAVAGAAPAATPVAAPATNAVVNTTIASALEASGNVAQ